MSRKSVKILSISDRRISLYAENYPLPYMNALRRVILSDVPTMAIEYAYFHDNTTSVYDEMVAHRLGLVVLRSDEALDKYKPPEECRDVEPPDPKCYAEFFLDVSVPSDNTSGIYVKASDLALSDKSVAPVYPETPIVYVAPGQRIRFEAYARLGRGREHGKWSPASESSLRYLPVVEYYPEKATPECLQCLSGYPEIVEALKGGKPGKMKLLGDVNTGALRYCSETACRGAVSVAYEESGLILRVESTGSLRPERIIMEAIRVIDGMVARLLEELGVERGA